MINVSNLQKVYGDTTACNIDQFTIRQGEILGLVGNNGAGKTTLFRLILDLIKPDRGIVTFQIENEQQILNINPAESELWKQYTGAYIDEGFLIDFLTPEEFFTFIGKAYNMNKEDIEKRQEDFKTFMAEEIIGQKKLIRDLSAGNKQKVGIIAAMFNKPQILILDEPFNFLDPSSQNNLKKLLTQYNAETGATIIISSHNLAHTIDISSRIALLEHGVIIKDFDNKQAAARQQLEEYFATNS